MKTIVLFLALALVALLLNSCCTGFSGPKYVEKQVTEWVEEEVYVESGAKGGPGTTKIVKRPVVKTVKVKVKCTPCKTRWCPSSDCCDTIGKGVYSRVTGQGGTGEPHIGLVPSMRVLAE